MTNPLQADRQSQLCQSALTGLCRVPLRLYAMLPRDYFDASCGDRRLLSLIELSRGRTRVTLFFLEPLPGSARINVTFDGTGLLDYLARPLDLDGDGLAGGKALI